MQLEKIVTDWYTFYCRPSALNNMKNCIIYISDYNLQCLKKAINDIVNNKDLSKFQKEIELESFNKIIGFVRKNNVELNKEFVQTDELEFIKENNSYIVVVKETKDVRLLKEGLKNLYIQKEENETIYVALFENAQIFTIKDSLCRTITKYEIPLFFTNIKDNYNE